MKRRTCESPLHQAVHDCGGALMVVHLDREAWQLSLDKYAPGCGSPTHVPGTNGGTMPCGGRLTWPDGRVTVQFCPHCEPKPATMSDSESDTFSWRDHVGRPHKPEDFDAARRLDEMRPLAEKALRWFAKTYPSLMIPECPSQSYRARRASFIIEDVGPFDFSDAFKGHEREVKAIKFFLREFLAVHETVVILERRVTSSTHVAEWKRDVEDVVARLV